MFKKLMMAGIAVGALALNAPIASASHVVGDCGFNSVQQDDVTGQTYQGAVYGIAVDNTGGTVSIRCEIEVNSVVVYTSPTGSGPGVATVADDVSFNATATDDVDMCAVVTSSEGTTRTCGQSESQEIPPPVVYETIDGVLNTYVWPTVDPIICGVIAGQAPGVPGAVDINSEGDVWVNGTPFFDCPPYNMDWDGDGQPG